MPPRHGKSEQTSHYFPAWYLSCWPWHRVILASYEADFAATWGRKVRNTLKENAGDVPVRLADDSTAADRWDTTMGGGMVTAGVGGPINGRGAHLLLVDDPIKNREEAESESHRRKAWDWWTSTAYTRMEPDGIAAVIMTRWHEDDLVGRLLREAENGGEPWTVLELPALAEAEDPLGRAEGEALWRGRYDEAAFARIRKAVGERDWHALYQQRPSASEGGMFKRSWWRYWRRSWERPPPDELADRTVVLPDDLAGFFQEQTSSWDCTFKDTDGSDFVFGGLVGCRGPRRFVMDAFWERADFVATAAAVEKMARAWPEATGHLIEAKANGPAVISALRRRVSGLIGVEPRGGKNARASAVTPLVEAGNVVLPLWAPWRPRFEEELASFPSGRHDDAVDFLSQVLTFLATRQYVDPDEPAPEARPEDWAKRRVDELMDRSQRRKREQELDLELGRDS